MTISHRSSTERLAKNFEPTGAYVSLEQLLPLHLCAQSIKLFSKKRTSSAQLGNFATRFRGRGMDFEEVRQYRPGDDIRNIDWRVTARTQVAHTKVYREERDRPVILAVDQRSPMFFGSRVCFKSVLAAHIAATLAWAALASGDKVGGAVLGNAQQKDIRPRKHKHAVLDFLSAILEYNALLDSPVATVSIGFADWLKTLRRICKPGACVFIVSDFFDLDDAAAEQLQQLGKHCELRLIHVFDSLERRLVADVPLTVFDGFQQTQLAADSKRFQKQFADQFEFNLEELTSKARSAGAQLLSFSTQEPLQMKLRKVFS